MKNRGWSMVNIVDAYKLLKEIIVDIKSLSDKSLSNDIMSKLLDIQEAIIDLRDENDELKSQIKSLEETDKEPEFLKDTIWNCDGTGTYSRNGTKIKICMHCSIKERKPMPLADQLNVYVCPECKTRFRKRGF